MSQTQIEATHHALAEAESIRHDQLDHDTARRVDAIIRSLHRALTPPPPRGCHLTLVRK